MCSCKTVYHGSNHTVQDTLITRFVDSTHVIHNFNYYDSITMEVTNTSKEKVVEIYNPETGKLSKRITESENSFRDFRQQLSQQLEEIELLKAQLAELKESHSETQEEIETETESPSLMQSALAFLIWLAIVAGCFTVGCKILKK